MISNCFLISVPYKQLSWPVCLLVFLISLVNIIRRDFCSDAASWLEEDTKVLSNLWCDCYVLQQGNGFGRSSQICAGIKPCWGEEYQWGSNGQPFSAGSLLKTRINLAAVHEVMEVVWDFQDVPFLKGKKCQQQVENAPSLLLVPIIWVALIFSHVLILLSTWFLWSRRPVITC